ncbi:MAG: hypothetical protein WB489_03915 [Pseudolabrys sp.]
MSQLLHAGIIAARRQLAALGVFTLGLLLTAQFIENAWPSITPLLSWGCLLVAFGFALTSGRSIEVTARRIRRGSDLSQVGGPKHVLMALTAQFGLAAILLAILALREPPHIITIVAEYFGVGSAASIIWAGVMSVVVACFGAISHAALKAIEFDNRAQ